MQFLIKTFLISIACFSLATKALASQNTYPTKPIKVIVPFAAGGSTDIIGRIVLAEMGKIMDQTMVIENRGGAGGAIGATVAANAKPDGYTLAMATVSTMAVNPACKPKSLPYNPLEFKPITNFAYVPNVIEVNSSFDAHNLQSFIEAIHKEPGKYSYGSSGTCGLAHLSIEAFKLATKTDFIHIPYKGSSPALQDAIGNQTQILFDNLPSSLPHIQADKLRALAVAWPTRLANLPHVPTFAEVGYPELNNPSWFGLVAPKGTPDHIIQQLYLVAKQALATPSVIQALQKVAAHPSGNTPEQFSHEIKQQYDWAHSVVTNIGVALE